MTSESDVRYKALACAVIGCAFSDLKDTSKKGMGNRMTAYHFFRGGARSRFQFWCDVAGLDRIAIQEKIFSNKKLVANALC